MVKQNNSWHHLSLDNTQFGWIYESHNNCVLAQFCPPQPADLQSHHLSLFSEACKKSHNGHRRESSPYSTTWSINYFIILLGFFFFLFCVSGLHGGISCSGLKWKEDTKWAGWENQGLWIWGGRGSIKRKRNWNRRKFRVAVIRNGKCTGGCC